MNNEIQNNKTKLTINGKTFLAENNQTILQACEKIGLFIPRFCYNEALSIAGNCRMCLVEIEKSPKLMPACAIKIGNDMKIYTKTNLVKKARESILEFLLINHPLDCPICDQGGECDLQDQAMVYGSDRGRFYEYKRSVQDKNAGPLIKTIMTRCIHCTRCIRYATEIAGIEVYGTTGRGKSMEVGTYISNLFNSEISGNVIDLCPVGALTSKPYAFTVRPWELKSIESIDIFDAIGSNIRIDIKGSQIMRILPKANNKINQQWISDKTRFAYDGLKCQRLYYPMIKKNEKLLTVSWKKAIEVIKNKILTTNPEKIGGIIGHFIDQETIISFKKLLSQLGSNKRYIEYINNYTPNQTNNFFDFRSNYISKFEFENFENNNNDTILLIGSNPRYETSMFNVRLRQAILKKKNLEIDVWSIGSTTNLTYESKQLGNNLNILYLLSQGKLNYSKKLLKSLNPIAILSHYTIERLDGKGIQKMLNLLFDYWSKINQNDTSIQKSNRKIHTISKKLRSKDELNSKNNLEKVETSRKNRIHLLHATATSPGSYDLGFTQYKNFKENLKNKLDLIYSIGADCKNNIFNKNAFIIYQGHHGCNTAKLANVILPSTAFIEKKGTYINIEGYIQESQIIINPEHEIYHDWQIIQKLANILNINGVNTNTNIFKKYLLKTESINNNNSKLKNTNSNLNLQFILNNFINMNISLKNINNKSSLSNLDSTANNIDLINNVKKKFETITPKLNNQLIQSIYPNKLNLKPLCLFNENNKINKNKTYLIYTSNINYDRDNFYLSDIITKSSITMGKCSALFKNNNFAI